ncbi:MULTISPECIES: hypothetical protein [Metallosphaera]|uniref:hypothetical protein n=1 Tax=Metallosphaera TaxID=41980 RepID=UPI001F065AFE|nr:hypothetical protein [Metallosphaera sedula]MCH1770556.1 hypothetical protein [Metallosphaera sedula]MCP6728754.1 hypothetical protein [Metallosphaera sedula]
MVFEVQLNVTDCQGRRGITRDGHLFCISSFLEQELQRLKIPPIVLAETIIDFLKEGTASYTSYWGSGEDGGITRILDLSVVTPDRTRRVFLVISRFNGINEITLLEPFYFTNVMEKLILYGKNLDKYQVTMPFLYKFVIFEAFHTFNKVTNVKYQGIISDGKEKYMVALEKQKALLWKIEEPKMKLVNREDITLMHLNY